MPAVLKVLKALGIKGVALILLGLLLVWSHIAYLNVKGDLSEAKSRNISQRIEAEAHNEAIETRHSEEMEALTKRLTLEKANVEEELTTALASIRDGKLKLRDKFYCPIVPTGPSGVAGGIGAAPRAVLSREDEEFLVRFAAEADEVTIERNKAVEAYNNVREAQREGRH